MHRENLEKHPEKIGDDVRKRLENAKKTTVAMYIQALQKRVVLRRIAEALFQPFDGLLLPGYPCVAAPIETAVGTVNGKESSFLGMGRTLTGPHNFTGFPVLMVPTGFSPAAGLPMEMQIVGLPGAEVRILRITHAYEQATPEVRNRVPELLGS